MHLIDKSVGFMGSVPIVAGTISLAVGAGFAISQKNSKSVSIAYIGDGGVEEGVFHGKHLLLLLRPLYMQ